MSGGQKLQFLVACSGCKAQLAEWATNDIRQNYCCAVQAFRSSIANLNTAHLQEVNKLKEEITQLKLKMMSMDTLEERMEEDKLLSPETHSVQNSAPGEAQHVQSQAVTQAADQLEEQLTEQQLSSPAIIFIGDRILAAVKNPKAESNLVNAFGGAGYAIWREHRSKTTAQMCEEVKKIVDRYQETEFHVFIVSGLNDIEEAKKEKTVLNVHNTIIEPLIALKTTVFRIKTVSWMMMIQDPLCGITPSVNTQIIELPAVKQGTISVLDSRQLPPESFVRRSTKNQEFYCLSKEGVKDLEILITQHLRDVTGFSAQELEMRKKAGDSFHQRKEAQ
jgi:hypothetical protein